MKTKICCLDVEESIVNYLSEDFNVYSGSMGKKVNMVDYYEHCYNKRVKLILNHDFPNNIQEYELYVIEMNNPQTIPYKEEKNEHRNLENEGALYFISDYPIQVFNPIPFGCMLLNELTKNIHYIK